MKDKYVKMINIIQLQIKILIKEKEKKCNSLNALYKIKKTWNTLFGGKMKEGHEKKKKNMKKKEESVFSREGEMIKDFLFFLLLGQGVTYCACERAPSP